MLTLHQFSCIILYFGPVENYTSHKLALNKVWISLEPVFKLKSRQYITWYCHFITPINSVWPEVERKWMLSSFAKGLSLTPGSENMTAVMNWKLKLLTKTFHNSKVEISAPLSETWSQLLKAEGLWEEMSVCLFKCRGAVRLREHHIQWDIGKAWLGQSRVPEKPRMQEMIWAAPTIPCSLLLLIYSLWRSFWCLRLHMVKSSEYTVSVILHSSWAKWNPSRNRAYLNLFTHARSITLSLPAFYPAMVNEVRTRALKPTLCICKISLPPPSLLLTLSSCWFCFTSDHFLSSSALSKDTKLQLQPLHRLLTPGALLCLFSAASSLSWEGTITPLSAHW